MWLPECGENLDGARSAGEQARPEAFGFRWRNRLGFLRRLLGKCRLLHGWFLARLISFLSYSVGLIRPAEFRHIVRVRKTEFYWAVIAFAGVALLGTLKGILVAVIASLLALAHQAYDPPVYALGRKRGTHVFRPLSEEHPEDETWPGLF